MLSAIDISSSALVAERARITALASNLANISSTRDEKGDLKAFQKKLVILQTDASVGTNGAAGVKAMVCPPQNVEPLYKYDPSNPEAVKEGPHKGYVAYPDVNMMEQFTDAIVAARVYEANLGVMQIAKDMEQQSLKIIA